jgi:hypothetical protein
MVYHPSGIVVEIVGTDAVDRGTSSYVLDEDVVAPYFFY